MHSEQVEKVSGNPAGKDVGVFTKNQIVPVTIEDISDTGEGIGHVDGFTLFVSKAVPGDTVRARIIKAKKTYAIAKAEEILEPAPGRVMPECPVAGSCGGCQLSYLSYKSQLELKQKKVEDCIRRIGGFADVPVLPIIGMEEPRAYRNKGQFPVGPANGGKPSPEGAVAAGKASSKAGGSSPKERDAVIGFYAGHSHRIVPTSCCGMLWPGHEEILAAVREYFTMSGAAPYDEETGQGLVRHVLMRKGFSTGEIVVCLVINGTKIPKPELLWERLQTVDGVVGLCLNVNREKTNVILGDRLIPLFGKASVTDRIGEVRFEISPMSFYQVNPVQTKVLYDTALAYAGLTGEETVWDLYCGIGTISLFLARSAKKVYGVEIVPEAIENAKENARINGIENAELYVGAAEEVFPRLTKENPAIGADVIVVDPPRKGCDGKLLSTMLAMAPARIVYVSCDPATLARDLRILADGGYRVERVQPVDQFPGSVHVENVALLLREEEKQCQDTRIDHA